MSTEPNCACAPSAAPTPPVTPATPEAAIQPPVSLEQVPHWTKSFEDFLNGTGDATHKVVDAGSSALDWALALPWPVLGVGALALVALIIALARSGERTHVENVHFTSPTVVYRPSRKARSSSR